MTLMDADLRSGHLFVSGYWSESIIYDEVFPIIYSTDQSKWVCVDRLMQTVF